ncbi:MAG: M67 family metallopeptidase [Alphaproteobacteria bacterium]|nr:M67 family metallopeptidase [Alphaproteobacteria bacterium]
MAPVSISKDLVTALERAAWRAHPNEACALLLGHQSAACMEISQVAITENVTQADPQLTFEVDPTMHILLQKAARVGGPAIVGVWHSHPCGKAIPSEADKARSIEPGWIWLISADAPDGMTHAAFRAGEDDARQFCQVPLLMNDS